MTDIETFPKTFPNNLFACPDCGGMHFNITNGGKLICNSYHETKYGCGWGSLVDMNIDNSLAEIAEKLLADGYTTDDIKTTLEEKCDRAVRDIEFNQRQLEREQLPDDLKTFLDETSC